MHQHVCRRWADLTARERRREGHHTGCQERTVLSRLCQCRLNRDGRIHLVSGTCTDVVLGTGTQVGIARWLRAMPPVVDPGFAKGGRTMASARSASLNRGLGVESSAGSRGRAPGGGSGGEASWSWKLFVNFYTIKWPKIKDLSENLPPCLSRAAMTSPKL